MTSIKQKLGLGKPIDDPVAAAIYEASKATYEAAIASRLPAPLEVRVPVIAVGIDPGTTGAIAVVGEDGAATAWDCPLMRGHGVIGAADAQCPMPDVVKILEILDQVTAIAGCTEVIVAIEQQWSRVNDSAHSQLILGANAAVWLSALRIKRLNYLPVAPQKWEHAMGVTHLRRIHDNQKLASLQVSKALNPEFAEEFLPRNKYHGRSDAYLMAEWVRRNVLEVEK